MVKSIQRIEQELAVIAKQVETLKTEGCDRYRLYLQQLGQSVQRQLVTAAYQVCTQAYPDEFLALSYGQRQELQQALRQTSRQSAARLLDLIAEPALRSPDSADLPARILSKLPLTPEQLQRIREKLRQHQADAPDAEASTPSDLPTTTPDPEPATASDGEVTSELSDFGDIPEAEPRESVVLPLPVNLGSMALATTTSELEHDRPAHREPPAPLPLDNPERLARWFQQVETGITKELQTLSNEVNRCLRTAAIFSADLPPKLLEAAVQAEEAGAAVGNSPNLLNLLIEAEREGDEENREALVLQVTAVCLRLPEVEFSDATLRASRQALRELLTKAGKLSKQYQKLQREQAIANAEAAWRSSWSDDD
ncbi:MAG: hypothetical protein HC910_05840 [Spirulinaceae cyanobacterium SM2_1_0]|nr:hypothetical protein [Spirulinaceae cyanobacterium SM2_1_0]